MLHATRTRITKDDGFSLIEILVVILIIGILAAIAIPSFVSQKDKASDTAAKSYARNLRTAQETYFIDNAAFTRSFASLTAIEPTLADRPDGVTDPTISTRGTPANEFTVTVRAKSGVRYTLRRGPDGRVTRSCDIASKGGCNAGRSW